TQIGSRLVGVLYILDEPSIGLHQRDNARLLDTLRELRDLGNTVLVVEHDEETIRAADHVVDLGPRAGRHGGEVVAAGPLADVLRHPDSLTARYLRGELRIPLPPARRLPAGVRSLRSVRGRGRNPRAALEPTAVHGPVHAHPRALHLPAGIQDPRLRTGPVLVQREGGPLRGLPGGRARQGRDALPPRRLRALRGVQGSPLQPRDARGPI